MLIFLLVVGARSSCLEWECKSLNETVCVEMYGHKMIGNSIGCPIDYYCKLSDFEDWYVLQNPSSNGWFHCTRQNYNFPVFDDNIFTHCGERNTDNVLAEGTYPKQCNSESDCLTKGGWANSCRCGMDGKSYCVPEVDAFDGYWDECESNYRDRANYALSSMSKHYWDTYQLYYVELSTCPECVKSLIYEFVVLNHLNQIILNSAYAIGILIVYQLL